jgi:hypothetical protein
MNGVPRPRRSSILAIYLPALPGWATFGTGPTGLFQFCDLFSRSHTL